MAYNYTAWCPKLLSSTLIGWEEPTEKGRKLELNEQNDSIHFSVMHFFLCQLLLIWHSLLLQEQR